VDQSAIHIAFSHRLKAVPVSGGVPTLEMLSEPQPYTQLLPDIFDRLIEATLLLPNIHARGVTRVGAVSTTMVAEEDLPPGIRRMIEYLGQPWGQIPEQFSFSGTYVVEEKTDWVDKCMHTISRNFDNSGLLQVVFDWGRNFKKINRANKEYLKKICIDAQRSSLQYLESVAEGTRFDG